MPLYENLDGTPVTTQSMVKAFRSCPREAYYKYHKRLSPKLTGKALTRGKWVHACIEDHHNGKNWKKTHKKYSKQFGRLFDEEREELGPLPTEIKTLMECYFWYYGDDEFAHLEWKVLGVEVMVEAMMTNGHLFRGKVDMIVEIDGEVWFVDHKTHKRLPDWLYRMMDEQSTMYVWAGREMGYKVRGFIWNYLTTEGFPKPRVLKAGNKFFADYMKASNCLPNFVADVRQAQKDYPDTFAKSEEDKEAIREKVKELKTQRWQGPMGMPNSPYFRRDYLEKTDDLIERTLKAVMRTSDTMHSYDFSDPDAVERDVNSCKGFFCNFRDLSLGDLVNGDSSLTEKRNYKVGDPLAYHKGEDNLK